MNPLNNNIHGKILVIGDVMLDHYIYGTCNRISPEAPVPVVEVMSEAYTLGGAGNVLKNLHALNCPANLVSVVGNDDSAAIVKSHLQKLNISNYHLVTDKQRCTTVKSRVMVSNHQLIRLDQEVVKPIDATIQQQVMAMIEPEIKNYDLVLISDYGKGLLTAQLLGSIFNACKKAGVKTLLDPKGTDFSKYRGVNIIKPNKKEAMLASGIVIADLESLKAACVRLKEITGCDDVVITMSEEGIAMFTNDELDVIPTKALDVIDVTGAGDTVLASIGLALVTGQSLHDACDFANHAAAVVVSKVGSATVTMDEINSRLVN